MEKGIKLYVVRFHFGAEVYVSLDNAKVIVGNYLCDASLNTNATIECWHSVRKITEGWQWISYDKRKIATRYAFDNSTEDRRLELFAKDFAKTHGRGYMREDVYTFSAVHDLNSADNGKLYGSLNGRPIDVDFLREYQRTPMYLARF